MTLIVVEKKNLLYTIDSDYLIRVWSLKTHKPITSYLLAENKGGREENKLTCAVADEESRFLAVGNEKGEISVHNIHSAGLLYQLDNLGAEVCALQFFIGATNFWLAAVGWEGRVSFFAKPIMSKNHYVVR